MFRFQLWILLFGMITAGCASAIPELYPSDDPKNSVEIFIVSHGWHVGIVVPIDSIFKEVMPSEIHAHSYNWAEIGWGDRNYYTQQSKGIWGTFRGGVLPTRSTVHIAAFDAHPVQQFRNQEMAAVALSPQGYREALDYIRNTLKLDGNGNPEVIMDGLYFDSVFYASDRIYMIPRTSNGWIARVLREAGYPISPNLSLSSGSVMRKLR